MIQRIGKRKFKIFAMDIESHNDKESQEKGETSMWLGSFIDETNKVDEERSYFYTMQEFINLLKEHSYKRRSKNKTRLCSNVCCYIFNLSFEYSFLLPVLYEMGFTYKDEIEENDEMVFNSVSTKSCSSVWLINIQFGKKYGRVMIRDLAKIFGGSLRKLAESFNLETQKGDLDYTLNRLHNYVITQEDKEYCFKDTRIIIDILQKMEDLNDRDFWNSSSMASYSMRKLLKTGYPRSYKPYSSFRKDYPELGKEETLFLREGVAGGLCFANERFQFKEIKGKIAHCDKHQMHPSSGYFNWFPKGEGEYFKGPPRHKNKIACCRILVSYSDALFHSIIKLIGISFITKKEITVWDFEIPTMYKCYKDLEIEYLDGYEYDIAPLPWRKYYAINYQKRLIAKEKKDDFNILYYKLLNNSSYGKLLEKPHNQIMVNIINEDGIIDSEVVDKDVEEINAKYTYLPVGSAIPAYSRVDLIETAWLLSPDFSKILYVDTDSIFFIWDKETEKVWNTLPQEDYLGNWGWEEMIDRAVFATPKRYKTESEGRSTFKAGGINFEDFLLKYKNKKNIAKDEKFELADVPFDEINIISSKYEVKRAYRVKGGTLIQFQTKEVQVPDKYLDIYEENVL